MLLSNAAEFFFLSELLLRIGCIRLAVEWLTFSDSRDWSMPSYFWSVNVLCLC